jgi:N-acetylneuraminic acid mutarotase
VEGRTLEQLKPTGNSFLISLSADRKDFEIIEVPPMLTPRSGHNLVFNSGRKMVFAIGGYERERGYLKETEVYSIENRQWYKLAELNVERSKATACMHNGSVYVFGGLTMNAKIQEIHAERFNYDTQKWEPIAYSGYDTPFTTNSTALSSLLPFQDKQTLFLFGGANVFNKTNQVQRILLEESSFLVDFKCKVEL